MIEDIFPANSLQSSAIALSITTCVYYFFSDPEDRQKILTIPNNLFWSTTRLDVMVCLTAVSVLFCVS